VEKESSFVIKFGEDRKRREERGLERRKTKEEERKSIDRLKANY
jgi:hypothetical protein